MLFQVVHNHTGENCPAGSSEKTKNISNWWQGLKKTPGLKVLSAYVSPLEHTFYLTVEADDFQTISRAMGYLMSFGTGRVSPILTLDQSIPIAESGAYWASK
jgi:hypothetical protein